jgi:DNA (cytosine-5)-methyltransferase 1
LKTIPFRRAEDGQYEITAADLFCGAGGTSTGLVKAVEELEAEYGIKLRLKLVAVNHWDVAIATHSANHSFAQHKCSGLTGVEPRSVIPGYLDLLVASPECTHHSNARGGKPMNDQSRSSGADVVRWIRDLRPSMVIIENVREYRTWGPLGKNNRPIKSRKGEYFQQFLADIRALGYATHDRLLNCADFANPTTRTRLFVYCKRIRWVEPIEWPAASHAKASSEPELVGNLPRWMTAREHVIDWQDLGSSILNRKRPLSPNTLRRIEAGLKKFSGIDLGGYLVKLYGTSDAASVDQPVPTVTGGGGHIGLAVPFQIRTDCAGGKTAGYRGIDDPVATVTTTGGPGVVEPQAFLLGQNYCDKRPSQPRSVDEPVPTVLGAGAISKVEPFMVAHFGEREGQEPRVHSVDEPTPAVTSRGAAELAQPFVTEYHNDAAGKERVRPIDEPLPTQDCANRFGLAQPFMMSAGGPKVAPRSVDAPSHTVLTRDHIGVASPFLAAAGGPEGMGRHPQSVDEPLGTVVTENHRAVIIPVTHPDKPGSDPASRTRSVDEPLPTITTAHRGEIGVATACLVQYNGTADVQSVDKPLGTVTSKPRYALLVTFTNGDKVLLDILFRMLRPRELARAQGFPDDYVFTGKTEDIVKQIGNAVPVNMAKALCKTALVQCSWAQEAGR